MPDIFFKCDACGHHLVVDEARRGMNAECPDCHAATTIPKVLIVHQCPQCQERLMLPPEMKGQPVRCSSCRAEIRLPDSAGDEERNELWALFICPNCHAEIRARTETLERDSPCPRCGERVQLGNHLPGPPSPKEYDRLRLRRKSR